LPERSARTVRRRTGCKQKRRVRCTPIAAVPGDEYGDRDRPPLALQNKWKPSYVNTGNRRNFLRELPAGPAVVPLINGGICADGRRTF
jgi:hypothetical protein